MFNEYVVVWSWLGKELKIYLTSDVENVVYYFNEKGLLNANKEPVGLNSVSIMGSQEVLFLHINKEFEGLYKACLNYVSSKTNNFPINVANNFYEFCKGSSIIIGGSKYNDIIKCISEIENDLLDIVDLKPTNKTNSKIIKISDNRNFIFKGFVWLLNLILFISIASIKYFYDGRMVRLFVMYSAFGVVRHVVKFAAIVIALESVSIL